MEKEVEEEKKQLLDDMEDIKKEIKVLNLEFEDISERVSEALNDNKVELFGFYSDRLAIINNKISCDCGYLNFLSNRYTRLVLKDLINKNIRKEEKKMIEIVGIEKIDYNKKDGKHVEGVKVHYNNLMPDKKMEGYLTGSEWLAPNTYDDICDSLGVVTLHGLLGDFNYRKNGNYVNVCGFLKKD